MVHVDDDLLVTFDLLADEVRPPALTLDLFTSELREDRDRELGEEPDDESISQALDPVAFPAARGRPGALMFAANVVFDHRLDDLVMPEAGS